ncbi:MAG TPA: diguanylate cyclase [Anaerolineaceae bacterium]|nr:diguanylate cyclase [Anaerolineaceae bacterium]
MEAAARQPKPTLNLIRSLEDNLKIGAAILDNASDGIIITDRNKKIILVNSAFTTITGYSMDEAIGRDPSFLRSGFHSQKFYEQMWDSINIIGRWQGEIKNRRKDGSIYPENLIVIVIQDEKKQPLYYVGIFSDLTLQNDTEEFLKYIATHDPLTSLPNRSRFYDFLNNAIYEARVNSHPIAVLFIDLDGFKNINDTFGHEIGDQLLQAVADRLQESVPSGAIVSRIGGDEFTIILNPIAAPTEASRAAMELIESISRPYHLDETVAQITASIGISIYPGDGDNAESLLQRADKAMYQVKESGKNGYAFFLIK